VLKNSTRKGRNMLVKKKMIMPKGERTDPSLILLTVAPNMNTHPQNNNKKEGQYKHLNRFNFLSRCTRFFFSFFFFRLSA
jgi:hypothetical protein